MTFLTRKYTPVHNDDHYSDYQEPFIFEDGDCEKEGIGFIFTIVHAQGHAMEVYGAMALYGLEGWEDSSLMEGHMPSWASNWANWYMNMAWLSIKAHIKSKYGIVAQLDPVTFDIHGLTDD